MAYEVTATRKRPQTFDEMVGQDFIVSTLKNSIQQGRIAHAYLFSGPRGVGKTSAARILAKALNCEQGPTDQPCGRCTSCNEIAQGNSLDVIEIDGASNTSVNDVREIKDEVLFAPNSSRYKVYIIDEVHMLSNSAFNALLKTIEEPPSYIVFIFATTEVHKVPATIRSRCQQFNFRLIASSQVKEMLQRVVDELSIQAEEAALFWIAKEATGSLRDAYTLLDQVISFSRDGISLERIRAKLGLVGLDQINRIAHIISQRDKKAILEECSEILDRGVSVEQFVVDLSDYFRNLLFLKCGIRNSSVLSGSPEDYPKELVEFFSTEQIEKAIELLLELHRNLRFSLQQRFDLELVMCQLASLQDLIDPAELLHTIRAVKADLFPSSAQSTAADQDSQIPAQAATETSPGERRTGKKSGSLKDLIEAVRREKLALSTLLEKCESWQIADGELRLDFVAQDRFSAEQVIKERDTVIKHAAAVFADQGVRRLRVEVLGGEQSGSQAVNEQAEIVKKIFRGEIVDKGE
ncbi:MAG: DNA polymerase III subunit gamma/tau [Spirochaetaceae bacterium]|nr:MAG: DNA polymerase III subunit gamma/tau [Spirochaetaceae bacterium]